MSRTQKGFTILELLVVIAIIGLMASVVLVSLTKARDRSKTAKTEILVNDLRQRLELYVSDTGQYPPNDCMVESDITFTCNALNDPFLNSLGVPKWAGPYISQWEKNHPWGGHVGYEFGGDDGTADGSGDGKPDYFIFLDDDKAGTVAANNSGLVPVAELINIDKAIDDGNLATGDMRGNGNGWSNQGTGLGEAAIRFDAR